MLAIASWAAVFATEADIWAAHDLVAISALALVISARVRLGFAYGRAQLFVEVDTRDTAVLRTEAATGHDRLWARGHALDVNASHSRLTSAGTVVGNAAVKVAEWNSHTGFDLGPTEGTTHWVVAAVQLQAVATFLVHGVETQKGHVICCCLRVLLSCLAAWRRLDTNQPSAQ